jgi:phytoene dehydrogenase-like protein
VIIIGAGLSGLSAGIHAQMNGYRSRIFEHHSQPGGVAASWSRGDYLIDGGIHFSTGCHPGTKTHALYEQLGIVPDVRLIEMHTYGQYVHEPSGATITVTQDLDQLEADLKAMSPHDASLVAKAIGMARGMRGIDMGEIGMAKPPELVSARDKVSELWASRTLLRHFMGAGGKRVSEVMGAAHDGRLQNFFETLFLPDVPLFMVGMILALLADGELSFIDGGCRDFVGALERRYRDLGGEITYEATVERILVEDDRAVGVRLEDGTEHRASAVISAADGRSTIFDMLRGTYVDDKIQKRYDTWKVFRPFIMVTFGVARTVDVEAAMTMVRLAQPLIVGPDVIDDVLIRVFDYSDKFAPPGKAVVQMEFETDWEHWRRLSDRSPDRYQAEKERLAGDVLSRLERYFPGIASDVEVTDVVTPMAIWEYTRNHNAAWEGWLMTPEQLRTRLRRTLPGLERFYMAGQWVVPGGGVVPVLYSGRHAVQLLCHDDDRPWAADIESTQTRAHRREHHET